MTISQQAVNHTLQGKTAMGAAFSGKAIRFTHNVETRAALAQACEQLSQGIKNALPLDNDQDLTTFITKMATYAAKHGWNTANELTHGFQNIHANLTDALTAEPELIRRKKIGLNGILRKHYQSAAQASAELRTRLINDNSTELPPFVLQAGDYHLVEILSPRHCQDESAVLKHCVGTHYNHDLLEQHGLTEGMPGAEHYLNYATKIRTGESRIFSLRDASNTPQATIEYDVKGKRIKQIQGERRKLTKNAALFTQKVTKSAHFFKSLCHALHTLRNTIDISEGIAGLPPIKAGYTLTYDGTETIYHNGIKTDHILTGTVNLHESMNENEVHELCNNRNLTLDMTACSNDWLNTVLPKIIKAALETESAKPLILNFPQQIGGITAAHTQQVSFSALQQAEHIFVEKAQHVTLPSLQNPTTILAGKDAIIITPDSSQHRIVRSGERLNTLNL